MLREKLREMGLSEEQTTKYEKEINQICSTSAIKETVCKEIYSKEPRADLLHEVLGIHPVIKDVVMTSDGFFFGRAKGDIGHNIFLGKPSEVSKARTKELFESLDRDTQDGLRVYLIQKGIPCQSIGITPLRERGRAPFQQI